MRGLIRGATNITLRRNLIHTVRKCMSSPAESTKTLSSSWADARRRFTCSSIIRFSGSGGHPSMTCPYATALRAKKVKPIPRVGQAQTLVGEVRTSLRQGPLGKRGLTLGALRRFRARLSEGDITQNLMSHLIDPPENAGPLRENAGISACSQRLPSTTRTSLDYARKRWDICRELPPTSRKTRRDVGSAAYLSEAAIAKFKARASRIGRTARNLFATRAIVVMSQPPKSRQTCGVPGV